MQNVAKEISLKTTFEEETKRSRKKSKHFDEINVIEDDANQLPPRDKFIIGSYHLVIDTLVAGICRRLDAYDGLCSRFDFLSKVLTLSNEELR